MQPAPDQTTSLTDFLHWLLPGMKEDGHADAKSLAMPNVHAVLFQKEHDGLTMNFERRSSWLSISCRMGRHSVTVRGTFKDMVDENTPDFDTFRLTGIDLAQEGTWGLQTTRSFVPDPDRYEGLGGKYTKLDPVRLEATRVLMHEALMAIEGKYTLPDAGLDKVFSAEPLKTIPRIGPWALHAGRMAKMRRKKPGLSP